MRLRLIQIKFGNQQEKLGLNKTESQSFPWGYDSHGSITGNVDKFLSKWKDEFDDDFLASVKVKVQDDENVDVNTQGMNAHITHEEVRIALNHVKLGKSVGIDLVPTEVLRKPYSQAQNAFKLQGYHIDMSHV